MNDPRSNPSSRGKRLRTIRSMAGLTRDQLEQKYGLSTYTVQSWESARAGGLTQRGAERFVPIAQNEGIYCTVDWLMYGVGEPPRPTYLQLNPKPEPDYKQDEATAITQELLLFRSLNRDAIDFVVSDNGMEPYYCKGDYVAGKRYFDDSIARLVGHNCIVQTINNEILLRRVKQSKQEGFYNLLCLNPDTVIDRTTLYNQKLISAAPVIWHRRRDPF
jgi:transcriptional regulator with XRE-family HTH domain